MVREMCLDRRVANTQRARVGGISGRHVTDGRLLDVVRRANMEGGIGFHRSVVQPARRQRQLLLAGRLVERLLRAIADYREMVRDVLGATWGASRCGPADGVSTTRQRPYEEVVPLLSAWTQD